MSNIVLQKYIVDSGHCSRRQATELIKQGHVEVNGKKAELGQRVSEKDEVKIGKKIIKRDEEKIYIILNKPEGYVCSNRRFKGEKNVFELLIDKTGKQPELNHRLFIVGRLDKNSHGLVLLTNDGELAEKITHPKYEHQKEYEVIVKNEKPNAQSIIENLKKGVYIGDGDGMVKVREAEYLGEKKFKIILTQGKKRQIRRMFEALELYIKDLKRVSIGAGRTQIVLGDLPKSKWRCLSEEEVGRLVGR